MSLFAQKPSCIVQGARCHLGAVQLRLSARDLSSRGAKRIMHFAGVSRYILVVIALCAIPSYGKGLTAHPQLNERTADSLGKSLASLFLVKERNVPAARHSMGVFQTITEHHVLQKGDDIKAQQKRQLDQYAQDQIVSPTQSYLNETLKEHLQGLTPNITAIAEAMQPNLAYFTDPDQDFISDFFQALTPSGTEIGAVQGPDFIDSAPCLIGTVASGVNIVASAIQIIPSFFSITPQSIGIFPQGINIQPAVLYISPYGSNISPIGVNIQPVLISITPLLDSINPVAVAVAPTLITAGGSRKLLAQDPGTEGEVSYGDVFLQSYETWMQATADMAVRSEATPQDASSFLAMVFEKTGHHLDTFQSLSDFVEGVKTHQGAFNLTQDWEELKDEFQQLYPVAVLQAALNGSLHDPSFNLSSLLPTGVSFQDPLFFDDQGFNVSSQTQGFAVASSFIQYAPCLVANAPTGIAISPAGISVEPSAVVVTPQGINVQPQGINIQPVLIYVAPIASSVTPTGVSIGPTLINIVPTLHSVGDSAVSVDDTLVNIDKDGQVTIGNSGGSSGSGATAAASG